MFLLLIFFSRFSLLYSVGKVNIQDPSPLRHILFNYTTLSPTSLSVIMPLPIYFGNRETEKAENLGKRNTLSLYSKSCYYGLN